MAARKGFTLLEIIVVLIIIGIATAFILPNLITSAEQTKAQAAKNNLLAIAAAQEKYSEDNSGAYCTANLNSCLILSISDTFAYSCSTVTAPYSCTATDGTVTLALAVNAATRAVSVNCTAGGSSCPN